MKIPPWLKRIVRLALRIARLLKRRDPSDEDYPEVVLDGASLVGTFLDLIDEAGDVGEVAGELVDQFLRTLDAWVDEVRVTVRSFAAPTSSN